MRSVIAASVVLAFAIFQDMGHFHVVSCMTAWMVSTFLMDRKVLSAQGVEMGDSWGSAWSTGRRVHVTGCLVAEWRDVGMQTRESHTTPVSVRLAKGVCKRIFPPPVKVQFYFPYSCIHSHTTLAGTGQIMQGDLNLLYQTLHKKKGGREIETRDLSLPMSQNKGVQWPLMDPQLMMMMMSIFIVTVQAL